MLVRLSEREGEVKAFLRLTPGLFKPACDSIIVAIGLGLPLVVVVAVVPPSAVLMVADTPSSRLLVVSGMPPLRSPVITPLPLVTGTPLLGSQAVAVSGLLLVKG